MHILKKELEELLESKINYIISHFQYTDNFIGFSGDRHQNFADDYGAGGLGILKVLSLYRLYKSKTLEYSENDFSCISSLTNKEDFYGDISTNEATI